MRMLNDDEYASKKIENANKLHYLEGRMSVELEKLQPVDGTILVHRWVFDLLSTIVSYLLELRKWQRIHDNHF